MQRIKLRISEVDIVFPEQTCKCGEEFDECLVSVNEIHVNGWPICSNCGEDLYHSNDITIRIPDNILMISNVDLRLLNKQRKELVELKMGERFVDETPALDGIINMLDEWSDKKEV